MSRIFHIASGLFALFVANVAAAATTLSPLPGSTPQTARPGQGFPNAVGVRATDDSNAPVAGLPVTFTTPGAWIYAQPVNVNTVTVNTDANGIATVPAPGIWAIADPGAYQATVSATGATSATFALSVGGAPPDSMVNVSGAGQIFAPGELSRPFAIRLLDAGGTPVPYPIAYFVAPVGSPPQVNASFNGARFAVVSGDVNGVVVSPPLLAGSVSGVAYLSAWTYVAPASQLGGEPLSFTIAPGLHPTLSPLPGSTPQTARPGQGFPNAVGVKATDNSNAPVAGLPVTFTMPGSWIYAQQINVNTVTVNTDANGIATVPSPGIWAIADPGTYQATASAAGAVSATFALSVGGAPPASFLGVSGAGQTIAPGGLSQPFGIRVVDAGGTPIPYPIVYFIAPGSPPEVNASFNGARIVVVDGDVNGVAVSPPLLAGSVSGVEYLQAFIFVAPGNQLGSNALLPFTIASPPLQVTLSPLPGSTPQSTCLDCFFPTQVGVVARNADGTPAPGVTVTFNGDDESIALVPLNNGQMAFDVVTGADGIARASSQFSPRGYIAVGTGSAVITASSGSALNQVQFNLSASGNPQNRIELLSGGVQSARVGGQYAPLVVRASDDNGPVANAAVQFTSTGGAGDPSVTFSGSGMIYVPADAQGIASSPAPVASSIAGPVLVSAYVHGDHGDYPVSWVPGVSLTFQNTSGDPGYGLLRPWQVPPLSIAVGSSTAIPFAMQVLDASGRPVANAPVIFTTDPGCATFNGARTVTATSDANGIATSPSLKGTRASVACGTSVHVQGQSRDLTMHVFDPAKVQATISPNFALVHYLDENYGLSLGFAEHGRPVHVSQVSVSALSPVGMSYAAIPAIRVLDGSVFIGLTPSQRAGTYVVEVTTIGGQRFFVPVVQVP